MSTVKAKTWTFEAKVKAKAIKILPLAVQTV